MNSGIKNDLIRTWPPLIKSVHQRLMQLEFTLKSFDVERPWGGFFVIHEKDTSKFIRQFFSEKEEELNQQEAALQPKILCVAPNQMLSWQYHDRRSEMWKLLNGKSALKRSYTDEEGGIEWMETDKIVELKAKERHRLIGLNEWGIIAEIWIHSDINHPSDEDDIHRLSDIYGRNTPNNK